MKKLILLPVLFLGLMSFSQKKSDRISSILSEARLENLKENSTIPGFIQFNKGLEPNISEIQELLNTFSKTKFTLKEVSRTDDQLGFTHIKYQQVINGTPLELSFAAIHLKNGRVVAVSGNLYSGRLSSSYISLSEKAALESALKSINAEQYKWQIAEEELFIKKEMNDNNATFYPEGELTLLETKAGLRLTYKFSIYAHKPVSKAEYYVDAVNGKVLFKNAIIHHADATGIGSTGYSGARVIVTDSFSSTPTNYRLRESGRGNGIETYDMNTGTTYGNAVDFTDSDNNWTSTTNDDQYALDAHWGAEMTYDYFWTVHSRNSIDGSGFALKSYIHYDANYVNAFWDGQRMTYGDGNGTTTSPLTTMAIAGHEITHGLISRTANLVYSYESGALNESFADIFGVCIDFWSRPTLANWLMGDEIYITGNSYFRSMSNPNARNDPDTYLGTNWYAGTGDNGGVHTNSGVQNFWFYTLVTGGSGTNDLGNAYNVSALGMDTASRIAFRALTTPGYLSRNSQYSDARFYSIKSATDLYGACSPAVIATTNAWYAVGVGGPYVAGVQSIFATGDSVGCKIPHTVSFTNNSNNATAFIWDFGDGSTSTAVNPTHTYYGFGPYSVELYANGGTCGDDTLIKVANVRIDTSLPCPVILARNGTGSSNECSGTLYDDGGASGDYSANQVSYFTIAPTNAVNVTLNFSFFDVELGDIGTSCNYDYLEVYDGNSTAAPLLGRYCNNNLPPASLTSSGGTMLIKFRVDGGQEEAGFKLDWNCLQHTSPLPLALMTTGDTNICKNETVAFTNTSYNFTSHTWSFPGGTPATSTSANPIVTYNTGGTYNARLIATNSNGSDTTYQTIVAKSVCPVTMTPNGTITLVSCDGQLIDDGGLTGDYSPNQTSYATISPTGAQNVVLNFNSFDVEADNCIYDYMKIYDGASTSSPLIGKYCNSTLPPNPLVSTGGSLTIEFYADAGLELDGYNIGWHCSLVGISELDKIEKVSIYPNPTTNQVTLEVDFNQATSLNVKIIDLLGKVHYQSTTEDQALQFTDKIDVSNLTSGTYIIYVNDQAHKLIKQ